MNIKEQIPPNKSLSISVAAPYVAELTLTGATKGNPFGSELWTTLPIAIKKLTDDPQVRAIVLRSASTNFSYGLDLVEMAPLMMGSLNSGIKGRKEIEARVREWQLAFDAIAYCPKPVVVAVRGWCIGAGVEMIAACDIRVCSKDAKFSLREVKMGLAPDLGAIQRLPFIIGEGFVRQMALTGEDVDSDAARAMGLVNSVHEDGDAAREAAISIATKIASHSPQAVADIKRVLNARTSASIQQSLRDALLANASSMQSEDFVEAASAVIQKREPVFKDA